MERRKAIKNLGHSMGAIVASPFLLELLQSCQGPQSNWKPLFYSEEEGAFVKTLVDTFLPAVENLPAASKVNVHVFLDKVDVRSQMGSSLRRFRCCFKCN